MYPLLEIERYAVPYESLELKTIFNSIGWSATSQSLVIKDVSLYSIVAKRNTIDS